MQDYKDIIRDLGRPPLSPFQRALVPVARWYLGLLPTTLPNYYEHRQPLQRAKMEYEDECERRSFQAFFGGALTFTGADVLDFGCGYGGRTVRYKELGARSVAGTEIIPEMVAEARQFAELKGVEITIVQIEESRPLPFRDESFDIVCSYDVFEHAASVEEALQECYRLLRPNGTLYAVFPPFHLPHGGSHLHGYVSRSPFPNLLFPCPTLVVAAEQLMRARKQRYRPPVFRHSDPLWGVNGTTLSGFHRLITRIPFREVKCRHSPLVSPFRSKWERWHMKYYALPFKLVANLPLLWEIFTDRVILEATR